MEIKSFKLKKDIIFCFVSRWNLQKDFQTLFYAFRNFSNYQKNQENIKLLLIEKALILKMKI